MFKFLSDGTFYPLLILCEIWKNCSIRIFNELNKEFLCVFLKMPFLFKKRKVCSQYFVTSFLYFPLNVFLSVFINPSLGELSEYFT